MARDELLAFADAVEGSEFDAVWLSDLPVAPALEPLLGLAVIAGRTERLKLGANVVPLGRNPFLLAKELAQLDRVSGGRLLLSFVPGLEQPGERAVLGTVGADRGALLEATLAAVRGWWDGSEPARHGVAAETTRPLQDPLEVWLGGRGPRALERAGRHADGWLGSAVTAAEAAVARSRIEQVAADGGRVFDPEHFGMSIPYARTDPGDEVLAAMRSRREDVDARELIGIGQEHLRELVTAYVEAGISKFVLRPAQEVSGWRGELEWLSAAVASLQS